MHLNSKADQDRQGCLYVVAMPIGNTADLSPRAAAVLGEVDCIAAEDTRTTGRLMAELGLRVPMISYHDHNERQRTDELIGRIQSGRDIALVSEAGTPTVSDPGYRLVRAAVEADIRIVPIPGPSAAMAALSVSGLPTDRFSFVGFVPKKPGARRRAIDRLAGRPETLIFYESPRRILGFVRELSDIIGDRQAMVAREMTKAHEELIRGRLEEIADVLSTRDRIRGEITLIVAGADDAVPVTPEEIDAAIADLLEAADAPTAAVARQIAHTFDIPRKTAYEAVMKVKNKTASSE